MRTAPERRTAEYVACLALADTAHHLVVLADDRGLQPTENAVSLVRRDAVALYGPQLLAVTISLRALNAQPEQREDDPRLVAERSLQAQGLPSAGKALQ